MNCSTFSSPELTTSRTFAQSLSRAFDASADNSATMPSTHRVLPAGDHRVPPPFRGFAVRSEEPRHAFDARAPYERVHVVDCCDFLGAEARASLAAEGYRRVRVDNFSDVDYASTTLVELCAVAPGVPDLVGRIASALHCTGVLGANADAQDYRRCVATRIDYLAARGAEFHNDVRGHWSRCLFWILAIDVPDVAFVMPHAGVQWPLAAGELLVFDPALAHGLCRPADGAQVLEASFAHGDGGRQLFLTGEIPLSDAQWAALGAPWLPVEAHAQRGALDLTVAEFDGRTGAIRRPGDLQGCMARSVCYVGAAEPAFDGQPGH